MKQIKCNLSRGTQDIDNAIKEIELYKRQVVANTNVFLRRLGQIGIAVVNQRSAGQNFSTEFVVKQSSEGVLVGTLYVSGEELLFFEFGTGVKFNSKPSNHPDGVRLGMIIGEYGKGHGNNMYWYYKDDNDKWHRTSGIKAQMPVYMASVEILTQIERIAKEVFLV